MAAHALGEMAVCPDCYSIGSHAPQCPRALVPTVAALADPEMMKVLVEIRDLLAQISHGIGMTHDGIASIYEKADEILRYVKIGASR